MRADTKSFIIKSPTNFNIYYVSVYYYLNKLFSSVIFTIDEKNELYECNRMHV